MAEPRPSLLSIDAVTHVVPDIDACERAYCGTLGYRVVERSAVQVAEAERWAVPAMAGRRSLLLGPASGEPCHLRFIESASAASYRALTTFGWTATEIVVQDVDALASRLDGSAFRIIGGPKGLARFPMIRAMQALGPAGECLYFTEVGPGSGLDLAPALSFVGRVFIVVAAGADVHRMFEPYAAFSNEIDPPVATPVGVISWANGLPPETLHPHGLVKLGGGTMIELDGYPSIASTRAAASGELPPGMALVRFTVDRMPVPDQLVRGAGGELIEFASAAPTNPRPMEAAAADAR